MRKRKKQLMMAVVIAVTAGLGACDALSSSSTDSSGNTPTAVIVAADESVRVGTQVALSGRDSSDPNGENLTFAWAMEEIPPGSQAKLSSATTSIVTFTADEGGYYSITLQVTNVSTTASPVTFIRVEAIGAGNNHPPVANAGADQSVKIGAVAILDGSGSSDADQNPLTFQWSMLGAPATSAVTRVSSASEQRAFIFPDVKGDYVVKLKVSDGPDSDVDFVTVTASGT